MHVSFPVYGAEPIAAVRGVSLAFAQGEVVGLVGESGSGKTVLARAIMGLVPPPGRVIQGRVLFEGRDIGEMSEDEMRNVRGREISMVIPNPRSELNPLLRVGKQIASVAKYHLDIGWAEAERMAEDMLRKVAIPDPKRRFESYPHELSGGMAQRVVLANALICSPKFIISDDATSGLDVTIQAQVLDLMRNLVREHNTSTLFITRDIGITAHFCDRVAVIYAGAIVEMAKRETFFENPCHPYTIMLLAAFSHNPRLRRQWFKEGIRFKPSELGTACPFAPRCVRVHDRCRHEERPALHEIDPGHFVRCYFPVER
ncbi:MAG: ABC transporter ATP-binding protein [Planctomycetes bacterium]|nr:ABC transporter ATP-binding protein [Planctomycetota bacterium]